MPTDEEIKELRKKRLCHHCIGEAYLRAEVKEKGKRLKCSYCGSTDKAYRIGEMAERIAVVFECHYVRTSEQPNSWQCSLQADKESDYEWDRDGEPVVYAIMNAADIPEDAAADIHRILEDQYSDFDADTMGEETEFASDSYYDEKGTSDEFWQEEWRTFERSIKSQARFFSQTGADHLTSVFEGIEAMQTRKGRPMVVDAGPGTDLASLYRARTFQSDDKLEEALKRPDRHLGSPPSDLASAGRMNARGISVFYGANDPMVALAEVRPPVGSQVAVARFDIIRPIKLLDLTALSAVRMSGSIFDGAFAGRLERAMFLRSLSQRITKPVMPDDEAFEYLPTQAVADFLATGTVAQVDGIIFPSVQAAGKALNVVLFHKAARVEEMEIPNGTTLRASIGQWYEDGWEREYRVVEETPPKQKVAKRKRRKASPDFAALAAETNWSRHDSDVRPTTLKIDPTSVIVHLVGAVEFKTEEHSVSRYRWEKHEPDF